MMRFPSTVELLSRISGKIFHPNLLALLMLLLQAAARPEES
jgi:hypothetical protein